MTIDTKDKELTRRSKKWNWAPKFYERNKMSRNFQVAAIETDGNNPYVPVHWRIDAGTKQRIVHVAVPADTVDREIIAELCALNYLIRERHLLGSDKVPKNEVVGVSRGAIKRLWNQDTEKTNLIPWGRFLFPAIGDAKIDTINSVAWTKTHEVTEEVRIECVMPSRYTFPVAALNIDVALTRHAVERYMERRGTVSITNTMQSIRKILGGKSVRPLVMDEQRRFKKAMRHGKEAKYLIHPESSILFVMVLEDGEWTLVTVVDGEQEGGLTQAVYVRGRIEYRKS